MSGWLAVGGSGVGQEESGYGQEAAEGDGAAETMAQEGDGEARCHDAWQGCRSVGV